MAFVTSTFKGIRTGDAGGVTVFIRIKAGLIYMHAWAQIYARYCSRMNEINAWPHLNATGAKVNARTVPYIMEN